MIAHREHLDRINVFPVPDRDTGTNLAATMRAVVAGLRKPLPSVNAVSTTMAACALEGAQGNSGVILAQFFQGLREELGGGVHVTVERFTSAMRHAALRARQALAQPREGTILTVMTDVAEHLASACRERGHDFRTLLDEGLHAARRSVAETPQRLAALRHAGVVDAGALGFVHFLEGIRDYLFHEEGRIADETADEAPPQQTAPMPAADEPLDFRYCTEATLRGARLDRDRVLACLSALGDSVVVAGNDEVLHAHVHTNVPAVALEALTDWGTLAATKVDDMWQKLAWPSPDPGRSETAVVTDSVCDLAIEFLAAKRIVAIPFRVTFGDETAVDGVDITARRFYARLASCSRLPTTSQPSPADFETAYRLLACRFASIVSVHLSSAVSGTVDSARRAAARIAAETHTRIDVVDSRTASAGEACVVWAAAQAAGKGLDSEACARVAQDAAAAASIYVYVPTVRYLVLGGRLSPLQGRLAALLRVLPVLTMRDGKVVPAGKALGRRAAIRQVVRRALHQAATAVHPLFAISHSEAPKLASALEKALRKRFPGAQILVGSAGPALGSHAGPGGVTVATVDAAIVTDAIARELGR